MTNLKFSSRLNLQLLKIHFSILSKLLRPNLKSKKYCTTMPIT